MELSQVNESKNPNKVNFTNKSQVEKMISSKIIKLMKLSQVKSQVDE